tara:strand:+ start:248 stop:1402 length:1155 start_codon:yes stop_codon:yes gene_type:complete
MSKSVYNYKKLLIISDTSMKIDDTGKIKILEPVAREIQHVEKLFDEITWIGYDYSDDKTINFKGIKSQKINYVVLERTGGKYFMDKINIIKNIIPYTALLLRHIHKHNIIHTRCPSLPGFITIIISRFFTKKVFWHKYAGDWSSRNIPPFYRLQRLLLNISIPSPSFVGINGNWPIQKRHLVNIENPCLTKGELDSGYEVTEKKDYYGNIKICFVGRLDKKKGVDRIIEAIKILDNKKWIDNVYFIGDGPDRNEFELNAENIKNIKINFTGAIFRQELNEYYKKCHIIILPSLSEGFPKVITEAIAYGCVPISSNSGSVGQYLTRDFGIILNNISPKTISTTLIKIEKNRNILKNKAAKGYQLASFFLYEKYNEKIKGLLTKYA